MKNCYYTTKKNLVATLLLAIIILLSGCKKQHLLQPAENDLSLISNKSAVSVNANMAYSSEKVVDLVVGTELTKIGKIIIKPYSTTMMEVTYVVDAPWKLTSTRLFIGSHTEIPVNASGIAIPNSFPFKQNLTSGGQTYSTFLINTSVIHGCKSVAAYATVFNSVLVTPDESCWAKGIKITTTGDWGMYYSYCMDGHKPNFDID